MSMSLPRRIVPRQTLPIRRGQYALRSFIISSASLRIWIKSFRSSWSFIFFSDFVKFQGNFKVRGKNVNAEVFGGFQLGLFVFFFQPKIQEGSGFPCDFAP